MERDPDEPTDGYGTSSEMVEHAESEPAQPTRPTADDDPDVDVRGTP
jgi:hypothetical protein